MSGNETGRPPLGRRIARSRAARPFVDFARELIDQQRLRSPLIFGDSSRVTLGEHVKLNDALLNTVSGSITIDRDAFLGHRVSLLTGTHDIEHRGRDRQRAIPSHGRDIVIEEGAWIASNATVIGPCRIGRHAVVAAGAVVTEDVPAFAVVVGVPARVVRYLPDGD